MERREFLAKCGAGLAGIIASWRAPAVIVKSMLSVKGADFIISNVSDFPYVTKGLVAMWDGEWNAGIGVHSETANPTNLCGDKVVPLTWHGTGDIEAKAFVLDSTTYGEGTTVDFRNWNGITLEYCVDYRNFGLSVPSGSFGWGGGSNTKVRPAFLSGNKHFSNGRQATCWDTYTFNTTVPKKGTTTVVFDFDSLTVTLYNNGVYVSMANIKTIGSKISTSNFIINKWLTISPSTRLALHSGRVHSRALTAEEVAGNYSIDRERFGL